jgi:hypothetical protein
MYTPASQNLGSDYCCSGTGSKNAGCGFLRRASFSPFAPTQSSAAPIMPEEPAERVAGCFFHEM